MKIFLGADHAGYELKEELKKWLLENGYDVEDLGTNNPDPLDDYPDFVSPVADMVSRTNDARGVVVGGSGQGEAMMANRYRGIRASVYYGGDLSIIRETREDNNSNILSIGARFASEEEAVGALKTWIESPFSTDPKYQRRNEKLDEPVQ